LWVAGSSAAGGQLESLAFPPEGVNFESVMADTEKRYLKAALEKADGVRTRAADLLKISYRSFRHYAPKHDL
jgi:two-component system response regulator PilR (NtrC family)